MIRIPFIRELLRLNYVKMLKVSSNMIILLNNARQYITHKKLRKHQNPFLPDTINGELIDCYM